MDDWKPRNVIEHDKTCPEEEFVPPNKCEATNAMAGTKDRLDVYAQRVRDGQPLHHKDDGPKFGG